MLQISTTEVLQPGSGTWVAVGMAAAAIFVPPVGDMGLLPQSPTFSYATALQEWLSGKPVMKTVCLGAKITFAQISKNNFKWKQPTDFWNQ